jgi:hypothetical protein
MSETLLEITLEQKAKKIGGDKYICLTDKTFTIYIPQSISRKGDKVHEKLILKIEASN